jgi:hypothetical protein
LKREDALQPLILNFAVEYVIGQVRENQEQVKRKHQFLVCADDIITLNKNINVIKKNTDALL